MHEVTVHDSEWQCSCGERDSYSYPNPVRVYDYARTHFLENRPSAFYDFRVDQTYTADDDPEDNTVTDKDFAPEDRIANHFEGSIKPWVFRMVNGDEYVGRVLSTTITADGTPILIQIANNGFVAELNWNAVMLISEIEETKPAVVVEYPWTRETTERSSEVNRWVDALYLYTNKQEKTPAELSDDVNKNWSTEK